MPLSIARPVSTSDAEGNYSSTLGNPVSVMGSWGSASTTEMSQAAQRGQVVDSACIVPSGTDIATGDTVSAAGHTWQVTGTKNLQVHIRALMRQVV